MQIPVEYFMWVGVVGSCGHLAHVLPFFHLRRKWWCEGNRDVEWWGSWLRAEWHATHTYWWIFHVQPQSEQQKTLMFVYTSVLLSCNPGCSNNELRFKQIDNTKASHWPTKVLLSRRKHLSCCCSECNFSKIFMKSQQTHKVSLHSQVAAGLFPYPRPALFIYKLYWATFWNQDVFFYNLCLFKLSVMTTVK